MCRVQYWVGLVAGWLLLLLLLMVRRMLGPALVSGL